MNLDVQTLTAERFARQTERTIKQQGLGSTDGALAIIDRYFEHTKEYVRTLKVPEEISILSPEIISLLCLQMGIASIGRDHKQYQTIYALGRAIEAEVFAEQIRQKAEGDKQRQKDIARITKSVMRRGGSVSHRKAAFRAAIRQTRIETQETWSSKKAAKIGGWLYDICLNSPVFVRVEEPFLHLTLTEEAMEVAHAMIDRLMTERPVLLPVFEKPAPWVDNMAAIEGYKRPLVRSRSKPVQAAVRRAIKDGSMAPVLEAVNIVQETAWRINPFVRDMLKWAINERIDVDGVPRNSLEAPVKDKPWDDMDDTEKRIWKKLAADVALANNVALCDSLQVARDMAVVAYIEDKVFYTHCNLDYRGRVYFLPHFNFQRSDSIRALFQFAEGEPLDAEGFYWLQVHVANCGDFDKVSKRPFADRISWVNENWARITEMVSDPKQDLWWTEADSPFLFLAACKALVDCTYDPTAPCHIPVSFDGTCSGLQHLAAMTRCEDTAKLVNLVEVDKPQDVYTTVAMLAETFIREDLANPDLSNIANICLENGITRSLVKRNVMTYSYSSGKYGMRQQHLEDTMAPLAFDVLTGKLEKHPYAVEGDINPGYTASRYLADRIHASIETVVKRPAEAMGFLQTCARAVAHEGKPLVWTTPLGLPVVLLCPKYTSTQISLFLHDRGVKVRQTVRVQEETKAMDKQKMASAVAPCFVHSMDACHLMEVVRRSKDQGIKDVALVHDSFGCLPNHASRFREIIKESFAWLYNRDILADMRKETLEQIDTNGHRVGGLPEYGSYQPAEIMEAEYTFA